jgi:hypothetical protein
MRGTVWLFVAALMAAPAAAQQAPAGQDSLSAQLRILQSRLDSLERVVAQLRASQEDTAEVVDELAALRAAAQAAAAEGEAARPEPEAPQTSRTRNLQMLNPEISVTGDFVGNFTAPQGESNNVSATPREFEFSFQAALDPYSRTKIFVTREQDFEIAGFPEEEGEAEEHGGFEIEEGYMYWVGLPGGVGAKVGKFRQEIGLYNRWHTHALFEVERSLAAVTFLGEDGLIQTGAAITLPSLTLGPATQTATFEVTLGDNQALFDNSNEMSYLGRLQSFWDLGASSYLQFGATGVYGQNDDEFLTSRLVAVDLSYRWTPPGRALYRDFQLKSEWYFVEKDFELTESTGNGGYVQANFRASRRWILGVRGDYLNGFGSEPKIFQLAPSISWWQSEWVRLRIQYNFLKPQGEAGNHTVLFQAVWAVGPHKHETY